MGWRSVDLLVFVPYFALHIVITLIADIQGVLPAWVLEQHYPQVLRQLVLDYTEQTQDETLTNPPVWMQSMLWMEVVFQLPFFFVALYALLARANWIRIPSIVYSAHVMTTVVPTVANILVQPISLSNKLQLAPLYLIFFVVPLLLLVRMAASPIPYAAADAGLADKKRR